MLFEIAIIDEGICGRLSLGEFACSAEGHGHPSGQVSRTYISTFEDDLMVGSFDEEVRL